VKKLIIYSTLFLILQACVDKPMKNDSFDSEETKAVMEEVAQSIGVQTDGLVSNFLDATANLGQGGPNQPRIMPTQQPDSSVIGNATNIKLSVDFRTGIHTLEFDRSVRTAEFSKNLSAILKYLYRNKSGTPLLMPRRNQGELETIQFSGFKTGETTTSFHRSGFQRTDSMYFKGMNRQNQAITVRGFQSSKGFFESSANDEEIFRYYNSVFIYDNVQIRKQAVNERDFTRSLSGVIEFNFYSKKLQGTDTLTVNYSGKIELMGDGNALLRTKFINEPLLIDLKLGKIIPRGGRNGRP